MDTTSPCSPHSGDGRWFVHLVAHRRRYRHTASFFKRTDGRLTEPPSFSAACSSLCSRSVAPLIAFLPFYGLITPTRRTVPSSPPPSLHARTFSGPISLSVRNLTHLVPFEGSLKSTTAWSSSVFVPPILKVVISPFPLFRRTKGPWIGFQQPAKSKRDRTRLESDLSEGVGGGGAE